MLTVLYEDNHIIVVLKPQNKPSQPDASNDEDMLTSVKNYIKETKNKPGEAFVGLLHRLDRPTGGVMVFAKTSKGASRVSQQIASKNFKKYYYAVVQGKPFALRNKISHFLKKDERTNTVVVTPQSVEGAKLAELSYEIVASNDEHSLVKVELHTGRSHQIRVQLKHIGHPIVGDAKYGNAKAGQKLALWAYEVSFEHPTTQQNLVFKILPPLTESPWNSFKIS